MFKLVLSLGFILMALSVASGLALIFTATNKDLKRERRHVLRLSMRVSMIAGLIVLLLSVLFLPFR